MAEASVLNMEGNEVEKLNLNDGIFGVEINEHLVHLAVVSQLATTVRVHRARRHVQKYAAAEENLETEGYRSCKTGIYQSSAVDRRRSCICSETERIF